MFPGKGSPLALFIIVFKNGRDEICPHVVYHSRDGIWCTIPQMGFAPIWCSIPGMGFSPIWYTIPGMGFAPYLVSPAGGHFLLLLLHHITSEGISPIGLYHNIFSLINFFPPYK